MEITVLPFCYRYDYFIIAVIFVTTVFSEFGTSIGSNLRATKKLFGPDHVLVETPDRDDSNSRLQSTTKTLKVTLFPNTTSSEIEKQKEQQYQGEEEQQWSRNLNIFDNLAGGRSVGSFFPAEFDYYLIPSSNHGGCIELHNGDTTAGNHLILGRCSDREAPHLSIVWRVDNFGMIHTALDDSLCMQAGYDGVHDDGVWLRVDHCDANNQFQKFTWDSLEAPITPQDRKDLCVVFAGNTAHIDIDPIILKKCNQISPNRLKWSGDRAEPYAGRYCPGYGGSFCSYKYDCYVCDDYPAGGICFDDNFLDTSRRPADTDLEDLCSTMNQPGAGRMCGDQFCPTKNFCVNCSEFLGYNMEGFVCLDQDATDVLTPCRRLNHHLDGD